MRFSRQIVLDEWGEAGQRRLGAASALVVGLGGLGCPAALYLARAGIGQLVLNDFDRVDITNLARQVLFVENDIGQPKVDAAKRTLQQQNSECQIRTIESRLQGSELQHEIAEVDVVLDGSDNFSTRFAVNAACVSRETPLVSGAAIRYEAQLAVFRPDLAEQPCYRCLYSEDAVDAEDCAGQGVLSPLVGMIGAAMAVEACRVIVGFGTAQPASLLTYDGLSGNWRRLVLPRDPDCPVCGPGQRQ